MRKYTCIVVDDEPLALERMARLILVNKNLVLIEKCSNAKEAMAALKSHPIDFLFLDIRMPGISGIEFAKTLDHKTPVIFTTAYEKYAIEGYELNVVDYLLKPVSEERFIVACERAIDRIAIKTAKEEKSGGFILINSEHQVYKILLNDILYVEALKDYVKLYVQGQSKPVLTRQNLKKIESQLPPQLFLRVHRSFIIALDKVKTVSRQKIFLDEAEIPLGDTFKKDFLEKFLN